MIESGITSLLNGSIEALVGNRIYPVTIPEGSALPCLSYQVISGASDYSMDGSAETEKTFQFDAWGKAYADVKAIMQALHSVLDGFSGTLSDGTEVTGTFRGIELDDFESEARVYRSLTEYTFHYQE